MKTPIDSATAGAGATTTLLNGGAEFVWADLYDIALNGGAHVRWHSGQFVTTPTFTAAAGQSTAANGTYSLGPGLDRGKISTKLGLEVATVEIKLTAASADLINGVPVIPFIVGRGLDGATITIWKAFLPNWASQITGLVNAFSGRVTAIKDASRTEVTITVSAFTVLLNVNMGPDVFQAGCLNEHYDANCGLTASNVGGTVSAGATPTAFNTSLSQADHYFDKGTITFTSGANNGLSRAIQSYAHASGAITVAYPFPNAPANGDAFNAVRGCLLTMADCAAQSNLIHFRGQPFTPPAISGAGL
jgi:uncharacterized phage protein (TIGR02218 family)